MPYRIAREPMSHSDAVIRPLHIREEGAIKQRAVNASR
jgi:hypothetical protein